MLAQCPESIAVGSSRSGDPKSLAHKELRPKNDGALQGSVPGVDPGYLLQECRRVVTGFRGDADSAEAGSRRAGGPDKERNPSMSEKTHEGQPPDSGGEELLTRKEVARRLRVHPSTVDNWRKRYGLPTIEKGYKVFFDWEDVKAWLKSGPMKAIRLTTAGRRGGAKRQLVVGDR